MKILMIGPFPPVVNGVTVSNDFLYRWLVSKGQDVSKINTETGLIASKQGDKLSISKILAFLSIYVHIFKVPGKSSVYMAIGQTFWGLVKYSPFILICKLLGIPYILHIHGGYVCNAYALMSASKKRIFRSLLEGSRSVIALSTSLATDLGKTFPNAHIDVVENFYDPMLIQNPIERKSHAVPRLLFLSNLMLGKGVLDFLDALLILKNDKQLEFEVALAGNIEKGIGDTLKQKIDALEGRVHFFGLADFDKKKELLYWSDIFVLPTWYIMEGQPLSIIEAYVTGNIVISTHQGGIKDISNYETFFKAEAQNSVALSYTLESIIAQRLTLQSGLQATAEAAQKRFDPENFLHAIERILNAQGAKSILAKKSRPGTVKHEPV
ncbi:glycosyltransferase family 4 protein [Flavobacterium sp.]|uniref:glycosyltransferase family 4 protein n=1 Tax=Flavobacterium sp. TaxID=239 RepID=UPI0025BD04F7|nr:glycosyltransferase family 4 protein [Flavobacterium sp.]